VRRGLRGGGRVGGREGAEGSRGCGGGTRGKAEQYEVRGERREKEVGVHPRSGREREKSSK